jgi:hypothetical protein
MRLVRLHLVAALLLALGAAAARAATEDWDVTGAVGAGIPVGDLADLVDPGFSAGLSTTRWMAPRWGIRAGGAGNFFDGGTFWHYNIGPEVALLDASQAVRLNAHAGLGLSTFQPDGGGDQSTDFTINLGATLEYKVNAAWSILGGPSFYIIIDDENAYILPLTAGFRYRFGSR